MPYLPAHHFLPCAPRLHPPHRPTLPQTAHQAPPCPAAHVQQHVGNEVSGETPDTHLQRSESMAPSASMGLQQQQQQAAQPSSSLVTSNTGRGRGPSMLGPGGRQQQQMAPMEGAGR